MDTVQEYVQSVTSTDIIINGKTLTQVIQEAALDLVSYIEEGIAEFYASYSPSMYGRTGGLTYTMRASDIGSIITNLPTISLTVQVHPDMKSSLWGSGDIDAFWLMNDGYAVRSGWFKNIPYFGYRSGARYVEKAVAKCKAKYAHINLMVNIERGSAW